MKGWRVTKVAFLRGLAKMRGRRQPPRQPVDFEAMAASGEQRGAWLSADRHGLARVFAEHEGRILHKWVHYLDVYERYFARYRGQPLRMLELGVSQGGSLEMWRSYFGPEATIFGIDINPQSATCVDPPNQVRIGSQADPQFLKSVIDEMGRPDIILDDGSHVASHQAASFRALFPLLNEGGLYVIEDLHTSYWGGSFEGGYRRGGTAIELAKQLVDDMHHWYHGEAIALSTDVEAVHSHDSIVVIEKRGAKQPMHLHVGRDAPEDGSIPANADLFPPR
jgi:hypothetical protein